jgi:flotillin
LFYVLTGLIVIVILSVIGSIVWYFYMKIRYRTVPSNEALIVTGPNLGDEKKEKNIYRDDQGRYMKVIRGGGHRLRMFQTGTRVSLKSFQLEIKTPKVYTQQGVGIYGEAVATLKVSDTLQGIVKYAEQFLGKSQKDISHEISEVLSSNLRAILSKMTVEQINGDRESFNEQVREIAQDQLDRMGFKITSFGLSDISDDEGYLENLGRPQIAEVKKTAEIAEAENIRETELKQAEVNEEVSKVKYEREMNIADTRKEKDIKDAKILAETQREKAIAEAAYELEQEERRLGIEKQRLEIKEQEKANDLKLKHMERENEVILEKQQVEVRKQQAEADYYTKVKEAEALAKSKVEEGRAEAQVIREKSIAEVEAIEKRAEALRKNKEVMLTEMIIKMVPEFAAAVAEPLGKVESIRILDGGNGKQVNALPKTVTNTMAALQESLGQMTGIDLEKIIDNLSAQNEKQEYPLDNEGLAEQNDPEQGGANTEELNDA